MKKGLAFLGMAPIIPILWFFQPVPQQHKQQTPKPPPPKGVATKYRGHSAGYWHWQYKRQHRRTLTMSHAIRTLVRSSPTGTHQLERDFLCIHSFEGSWTDPNAPYYGGLQMDQSFARTYGPEFYSAWGTPDHWPQSVQITVAMRAYLSGRGFHPWPNTARNCGLL